MPISLNPEDEDVDTFFEQAAKKAKKDKEDNLRANETAHYYLARNRVGPTTFDWDVLQKIVSAMMEFRENPRGMFVIKNKQELELQRIEKIVAGARNYFEEDEIPNLQKMLDVLYETYAPTGGPTCDPDGSPVPLSRWSLKDCLVYLGYISEDASFSTEEMLTLVETIIKASIQFKIENYTKENEASEINVGEQIDKILDED